MLKKYRKEGKKPFGPDAGRPNGGVGILAGSSNCAGDRGSLPGPIETSFFLVDEGSRWALMPSGLGFRFGLTVGGIWAVGFTPQKPIRRAFEQDEEKVRRWLQEEYPEIRKSPREKRPRFIGNEMGSMDHACGGPMGAGAKPVILGTGQRFGCSMISAITNEVRFISWFSSGGSAPKSFWISPAFGSAGGSRVI